MHAAPVRHHGAPGRGRAEAGPGLAPGLLGGTLTTNANVSLHHTKQLETLKMRVKSTKHSSFIEENDNFDLKLLLYLKVKTMSFLQQYFEFSKSTITIESVLRHNG